MLGKLSLFSFFPMMLMVGYMEFGLCLTRLAPILVCILGLVLQAEKNFFNPVVSCIYSHFYFVRLQ